MVGVGTGRAAGTQREDLLGGTQELGGLARKCTWLCVYGVHCVCAHTSALDAVCEYPPKNLTYAAVHLQDSFQEVLDQLYPRGQCVQGLLNHSNQDSNFILADISLWTRFLF